MRKRECVLLALTLALLLTGCSGIEERAMERSGIYDDPGYAAYRKAAESGEIVTEGEFSGYSREAVGFLEEKEREKAERGVRVTLAGNGKLSVTLYTDREKTAPIEGADVSLPAGTAVYAGVEVTSEAVSDRYVFDGFRVMTYYTGGAVEIVEEPAAGDGLVCVVPSDEAVEAVSILPLGRYEDRVLTLRAERLTPQGTRESFTGRWRVNGEYVDEGGVRISSASDYQVDYDYRGLAESYYLARESAEPAVATDDRGVASFPRQSPRGGAESFSLLFRPYIRGTLVNSGYKWLLSEDIISRVSVNGVALGDVKGETLELGSLKVGDTVKVRVKSGYEVRAEGLEVSERLETDSGRSAEYTLTVPESFYGLECTVEVRLRDGLSIDPPGAVPGNGR